MKQKFRDTKLGAKSLAHLDKVNEIIIDYNEGHYRIAVCVPCWSESAKSWHFLTIPGKTEGSWSQGVWFAKDKCILDPKGFITLPAWYYNVIFRGKEKPEILNHQ